MSPPILLASSSAWRAELLASVGIPCAVHPPTFDEATVLGSDPVDVAARRAAGKALSVALHHPGAWVLAADQVAHLDGETFGKPVDDADHRRRLRVLRGRTHTLVTVVQVVVDGVCHSTTSRTGVTFRADLADAELDAYVACGEGRGCAGGYRAEGRGAVLIERVDGDWFNVIGLPVFPLVSLLRLLGWTPPFLVAQAGAVT